MSDYIPNRQQLLDDYADLKAECQHARRMGNTSLLPEIVSQMTAIDRQLSYSNNITEQVIELSH